jgi:hypothetical protein
MFKLARLLSNARSVAYACAAILLVSTLSARAQHHAIVEWYADLSESGAVRGDASLPHARDIGRVSVAVDFPRQTITFHTNIKDIVGLRKIEVRTDRARGDFDGPAIFTIYDAHAGRLADSATRTVEGSAFSYVATPILNSRAAIAIVTDAHPDGEVVGQIIMHKRYEQ